MKLSDFQKLRIKVGATSPHPGYVASHFYTCAFLLESTILLDGDRLFERGRPVAFDDAEVREIAKRYGTPDEILARIA